jgi:hypothetical protein
LFCGAFVTEALAAARSTAGPTGPVLVRADAALYTAEVVAACRRAGAHFSITVRMNPAIAAAIARIDGDTWTPIGRVVRGLPLRRHIRRQHPHPADGADGIHPAGAGDGLGGD